MPEMPDVVSGEPVASAWGNDIRDRTVQRYADQAALAAESPLPEVGDLAFVDDSQSLLQWNGTTWGIRTLTRSGAGDDPAWSFIDEPTTGVWRRAGEFMLSVLGGQQLSVWNDRFLFGAGHNGQATIRSSASPPVEATPEYTFHGFTGTGMAMVGSNRIGLVASGVTRLWADGNGISVRTIPTSASPPDMVMDGSGLIHRSTTLMATQANVDDLTALVVALQAQVDAL